MSKTNSVFDRTDIDDGGAAGNSDFIDIFKNAGINDTQSEVSLNEDEISILKEFEDNDKELEDIAAQIVGALDELKGTAQNIENQVNRQGDLLKSANSKAEDLEVRLT